MDNWPQDRREELEKLEELLNSLRELNNGSDFISKIQNCINLADDLTKTNYKELKRSFIEYLYQEASKGE